MLIDFYQNRRPQSRIRSGFSLVEITLALMVVAIGILSVMSLFPVGLDQNMRSIADTQMALFADDVFQGLRVWAEDGWTNLDEAIIPPAAKDAWATNAKPFKLTYTNIFTNSYFMPDENTGNSLPHGEKYHIRFKPTLTTNAQKTVKAVTLHVWSGEFGSTNNPTIFYTEFFKK
ncbi:MAG: type IV pilus modification PilV family protein [Kiritimatiellia bacterium]|jgi:Tfp pilus assembly protein PilV